MTLSFDIPVDPPIEMDNTTGMVFTCLPNPAPGTRPRITVFVSPRLTGLGERLDAYALDNWPRKLAAAQLSVILDGAILSGSAIQRVAPDSGQALDEGLWNDLFPARSTPVRSRAFEDDMRIIRSYPVAAVARHLHDIYLRAAGDGGGAIPLFPHGAGDPGPVDYFVRDLRVVNAYLNDPAGEDNPNFLGGADEAQQRAFYWANRFYQRRKPWEEVEELPRPQTKELDFHEIVAALGDHPTLLYALGFAFDILLPAGVFLRSAGTVQLGILWRGESTPSPFDVCPITHYVTDQGHFLPEPELGEVDGGYLALNTVDAGGRLYDLVQVDTDGGALQSLDFGTTVHRTSNDPTRPPPRDTTLPTLRSGGLMIARRDRAAQLATTRARAQRLENGGRSPELWAEDLVRGYRIDVQTDGGAWRSLCQRQGTIDAAGHPFTPTDEGYAKACSATSTGRDDNQLYLHEAVFGWDGWSLAARRPGKAIDGPHDGDAPSDAPNALGAAGIQAEYVAKPGTLPRLRFGRRYRMRARAVDLAGNSLPLLDNDVTHATTEETYRRYEPVPPPQLVFRDTIIEAESIERMVLRTADEAANVRTSCSRHVVAPKATLATVEAHGKLDGALATGAPLARWYGLARKEKGTLLDDRIVDVETGGERTVAREIRNPPSVLDSVPVVPPTRGAPLEPGQYVVHRGSQLEIPYLPDPLAAGLTLVDASPASDSVGPTRVTVPYSATPVSWASGLSDWPLKRSLRIDLTGDTASDDAIHRPSGASNGVLTFSLPPGRTLHLRYSSSVDQLDQLALFGKLYEPPATPPTGFLIDARNGLNGMYTPARDLMLVHAVQRPVTAPELTSYSYVRNVGETAVSFDGRFAVHGWSTSQVDMRASWTEWSEDPEAPDGVRGVPHSGDAFHVVVPDGAAEVPLRAESVATHRQPNSDSGIDYLVESAETATAVSRPARHELGDTRCQTITYTPVGTTRFQEYFPAALINDRANLVRAGTPRTLEIASSSRPAAPSVLYAVPTFQWREDDGGWRHRYGRGLRIYLDAPWFQTGMGERLAVVCGHSSDDAPALVSTWGVDPVWTGGALPTLASVVVGNENQTYTSSYGGATQTWSAARVRQGTAELVENNFRPLTLFGHLPEWSRERKQWFVDVELAPGNDASYWPFVSLALARWQPSSLLTFDLSPIVRLHFAQLAPDRAATVVPNFDRWNVTVVGTSAGNANESYDGYPGPRIPRPGSPQRIHTGTMAAAHRVYARLESRPTGGGDLSWTTVSGPVELTARASPTGGVQWSGSVMSAGSGQRRIVVTESEVYDSDTGVVLDSGPGARIARERIVYIDQIPV
jgi:hypothetical protein